MSTQARPAFYALAPGSWRDYVTLLHPPYTLWHLSYVAIGIAGAFAWSLWLLVFVVVGGFVVVAYNLELFGGVLHNHQTFALTWGAFPLLTGYFASAGRITWEALLASAFAALSSAAQRVLSTPVRLVRRRVRAVSGTLELNDGDTQSIDAQSLIAAPETALRLLAVAIVALAGALLVLRLR